MSEWIPTLAIIAIVAIYLAGCAAAVWLDYREYRGGTRPAPVPEPEPLPDNVIPMDLTYGEKRNTRKVRRSTKHGEKRGIETEL